MKITIVLATYNADLTLERCLESLREQTFRDFEILVADGVSTDRTLEILKNYSSEIALVISENDQGIYDAWNKVVPRSTGDWLLFLGADDALWDRDVLARAVKVLEIASENVVYGKVAIVLPEGEILHFEGEAWEKIGSKFRHEMTIPHQGTFHRRALFEKYGLFDASFRICGDYEFLLRELKDHSARFIPDLVVARMAFGGVSSTYRNVPIIIRELSLARKKNGDFGLSLFIVMRWVRYYLRILIRFALGERAAHLMADLYRRLCGKPALWTRLKT